MTLRGYRVIVAALSIVAGVTLTRAADTSSGTPLVTLSNELPKTVQIDGGELKTLSTGLRITGEPGQSTVLTLTPESGHWDLSSREAITLMLKNPSKEPITVRARAENPDAQRLMNGSQNAIELLAGQSAPFVLRLTRRPEDPTYKVFETFYMYFKNMNVRDNTLDPSQVAKLTITIESWKPGQSLEVASIAATGTGPTEAPKFFPFVDSYGQYIHGDWPGKIYKDSDFAERVKEEERERANWPGPDDRNEYGGWAKGPKLKATGFFYAAKHEGKWWLVDPTGHLYWSYGPTGVGYGGDITPITDRENWFASLPDEKKFAQFYRNGKGATYKYYSEREWRGVDIQQVNLVRKYGPDYKQKVAELSHERLRSWGFNSIGNWSASELYRMHKTPYTVPIHVGGAMPMKWSDGHSFEDVYHPAWEPNLYATLEKERNRTANDPWCIGYFVDNERCVGWRPRAAAVGEIALKAPTNQPAKAKFIELLQKKYSDITKLNEAWKSQYASWEALKESREIPPFKDNPKFESDCGDFGMMFCERYFSLCRKAVKNVAPNNMFLGSRFYGHTDPEVVKLAGKYWDVISYNIYDNPPTGRANQLNSLDLPIMSTEWGVESDVLQTPFRDAKLTARLPKERCGDIIKYVEAALRHPNMVGAHFFQFRDQPLSGRPDGEATLRGFVNVADTPNFEMVQANRKLGYGMYKMRSEAK